MSNMVILSPRDFDQATLVASSQKDSLPVANLQSQRPKKVYRSLGTEEYITVSFSSGGVAANMLALNAHNMSSAGLARVWLADTLAHTFSAPAVDTGWQSVWPISGKPSLPDWPAYISAITWSNDTAYPFARVGLKDTGSTDGFIQVGRAALARYWQPSINYDFGATPLTRAPKDIQAETDAGAIFTDRRNKRPPRAMKRSVTALERQEVYDGLDEIMSLRGMWGDVFVFLDLDDGPNFQKQSMQGVFVGPTDHQEVAAWQDAGGNMLSVGNLNFRELV